MKTVRNLVVAVTAWIAAALPAAAQFSDQATFVAASTGSSNAYAIALPNVGAMADVRGVTIRFIPNFTNDGPATLAINGLDPVAIKKTSEGGKIALVSNEIVNGQLIEGAFDGTDFLLTSFFNAAPVGVIVPPQGRLTLTSGAPVMTGNVSAATTAYYTPYVGNQVPIYNGTSFVVFQFPQLTLTIPSSRLANLIYDACVFDNAGTPTVVMGPAWSNSAAGAGARGTGAGTPQLTRLQGIWVNAVSISGVNGGSTFSIPANECTYVGSVHMDGTNGQVSFLATFGQNRKTGVWNAYNRVPVTLLAGDSTASWPYTTTSFRASNGSANNSMTAFFGLAEEFASFTFNQAASNNNPGAGRNFGIGIGWNSTSATTAIPGWISAYSTLGSVLVSATTSMTRAPFLGINVATALEYGDTGTSFSGTEAGTGLQGTWRY